MGTRKAMRTDAEDVTPWNVINNAKCHSRRHGAKSHRAPIQELVFSSSVLGRVCMGVVLILRGVWEKINAYLLNISYKISSSILFFILPRPAKQDLKFRSHVTSSKVQF